MRETLATILSIASKIQALEAEKAKLEASVIADLKHDHIGQKTYDGKDYKITITTKINNKLDKAKLNAIWDTAGLELPINRSYAYTLREKDFDAVMSAGDPDLRALLADIVTQSPAKPHIKIEVK